MGMGKFMSDEYISTISGPFVSLKPIANALFLTDRYVIEQCTDTEAALRLSSKERRLDWPEDFALTRGAGNLLVAVCSATKHERDDIIRDVEIGSRGFGIKPSFKAIRRFVEGERAGELRKIQTLHVRLTDFCRGGGCACEIGFFRMRGLRSRRAGDSAALPARI
jgi:hypothetical protein